MLLPIRAGFKRAPSIDFHGKWHKPA